LSSSSSSTGCAITFDPRLDPKNDDDLFALEPFDLDDERSFDVGTLSWSDEEEEDDDDDADDDDDDDIDDEPLELPSSLN
jgi:hypothetical protein